MTFLGVLNFIWKNMKLILIGVVVFLFILLQQQCNKTKDAKAQLKQTTHIADQNLAAISDSSIQLKLTSKQLASVDSQLYLAQKKIDSLYNIKSKQITLTKIQYVPENVTLSNNLIFDKDKGLYGLHFTSFDSVRSFNGVSKFKIVKNDNTFDVIPDSTDIKNFKLNFDLVISQYEDSKSKFTRTKIVPYYVDSNGRLIAPISDQLLRINFRNAEILDKPWTENKPANQPETKTRLASGWALTLSPLAVGVYPAGNSMKFGYTPNIGISYYITLRKK